MYVENLVLNEFRAIARSNIEFIHPLSAGADSRELANINLLVGTNGGGKSTILKAIAAAALGDVVNLRDITGDAVLEWPRIGRTGDCYAEVTYVETTAGRVGDPTPAQRSRQSTTEKLAITADGVRHSRDDELGLGERPLNLFGYGPLRMVSSELDPSQALTPGATVANLFESNPHLYAPEPWLPDVSTDRVNEINVLMPPDTFLTGELREGQIEVENRGLKVARRMLSDGIQGYMAWVLDLIFRLMQSSDNGNFTGVTATVLVDEVDQRMHPQWQQSVLQRLADGLPNIQFICSAHSPLLAGGLRPENLTVLEPDHNAPGEGAMKASHLTEDIYGQTADGVLTSSYFNLASTRSEAFQQELRTLAEAAASIDQAAVDFMRMLTAGSSDDIHVRSEIVRRPDRLRRRRQ
jgi:energy-coupling factor transporter ATP-binding protein EcfA2